ncbi:inactive receptor-like serine/threonine-protein kinase At2g40270 [Aristolochia californica]|uniref:inactive receptor-like serine/threonine-protein kinase At2g40270 n=1 Tax=Aristolochia californica TaxID=171875 RepID=UPI0035E19A1C
MERYRLLFSFSLLLQSFYQCLSLNSEGWALLSFRDRIERDPFGALSSWRAGDDPCSWFGVGCFNGNIETLNLNSLFLEGTLAPVLGQLSHIKCLVLSNNSFSGPIPDEIRQLRQLEVLDLGKNNLSGELPFNLSDLPALKYLIITNNRFLVGLTPQIYELSVYSELHMEEVVSDVEQETCWDSISILRVTDQIGASETKRRLMQERDTISPFRRRMDKTNFTGSASSGPSLSPLSSISAPPNSSPMPAPAAAPASNPSPKEPSITKPISPSFSRGPPLSPSGSPLASGEAHHRHTSSWVIYGSIAVGVSFLLGISAIFVIFYHKNKVVTVRPWATGLSGQLQKAFVTGVPSLKRQELETACEDFSNIIGSSPDSTLFKGTLSSGVEIAVISSSITSPKEWSKHLEAQFRKQIETLSKVNCKNFVNLLGYCEEEEPFTRMMVFEYAPNGTLFEHLHVKEAEHLDWPARLRIAMGMAYCLEHMHQLNPPIGHKSLHSAVIYLTDDFAAKVADFGFWNIASAVKMGSGNSGLLESSSSDLESNVYNFGIILLEMMTGKLPYTDNEVPLIDWASDYMNGAQPLRLMMDPALTSFREEEASALGEMIRLCTNPDPKQRPTMKEVVNRLREITTISPDGATPRLSPLWWAELEILSTEAS